MWWINRVKSPVTLLTMMLLTMVLSPALHHSEGFGSAPLRTDETLLQQPSISWNQGRKCLYFILSDVAFVFFFSASSSFSSSLSLFFPPFPSPSSSVSFSLLWQCSQHHDWVDCYDSWDRWLVFSLAARENVPEGQTRLCVWVRVCVFGCLFSVTQW